MDLEKYRNDGWGISIEGFSALIECLNKLNENTKIISIIEFGSGISTQFFQDYARETQTSLDITSIDNDEHYKHKDATLCPLIECTDSAFEKMFSDKQFDKSLFSQRVASPHSRQHNCFYALPTKNLPQFDLMLLDGPHGNGRSLAFLSMKKYMNIGAYLFIDDYTHYDFEQRACRIFNTKEILRHASPRDNFLILQINSIKE